MKKFNQNNFDNIKQMFYSVTDKRRCDHIILNLIKKIKYHEIDKIYDMWSYLCDKSICDETIVKFMKKLNCTDSIIKL